LEKFNIVAILPAYNEEGKIAKVLVKTLKHVSKVIVVDDGSNDYTAEIAERMGAIVYRHGERLGKGEALKTGFEIAKKLGADIIVTLDADGQHDPDEIPLVIEPIMKGEADIVIGSRTLSNSKIPTIRKIGNDVLNKVTNIASGLKLTDTQSGFRAFTRKAIEMIEVKDHGMGVESQILIDAADKKLRIKEVPISVKYGKDTSTYNFLKHGSYVFIVILRTIIERSPLLYLGLPGIAVGAVGLALTIWLLALYNTERYFSIPLAILALGGILLGVILVVTALLLYAINNLHARLRRV